MNQFPPSPRVSHWDRFEFFRKFAEAFASQGTPPVSTTPVANCHDTGGKIAAGINNINDTGGKLTGANLPPVQTTSVANNGTNYQTADNLK
jgi:hypothetical protein